MYLKESSIRRWKGESKRGQDERKFNEKKWKGWGVLGGRFSEKNEKVELYLKESLVKKWKGWDVLEESSKIGG